MGSMRTKHTQQFKTKVALEAIKGQKTTAEITSTFGVHATQISTWKKKAVAIIPDAFSSKKLGAERDQEGLIDDLYQQIGRLTVERDWLKKKV